MVEVVAALIMDTAGDGRRFLICQRPKGKARELLWEFAGGKVEAGETKEEALFRECREELDIDLKIKSLFADVKYAYPDLTVHLSVYEAQIAAGVPARLEHNDLRWITPEEIGNYAFCPADTEILKKIKEKYM